MIVLYYSNRIYVIYFVLANISEWTLQLYFDRFYSWVLSGLFLSVLTRSYQFAE